MTKTRSIFSCHSPSCPSLLTPSPPRLSSSASTSICKHPFILTAKKELKVFVRSTAILSFLMLHAYALAIISSYNLLFVMIPYNPILKYHFSALISHWPISCISGNHGLSRWYFLNKLFILYIIFSFISILCFI